MALSKICTNVCVDRIHRSVRVGCCAPNKLFVGANVEWRVALQREVAGIAHYHGH